MELLKKENWWIWLLLLLFSGGTSSVVLGALLGTFDKNAWYAKWYIWVFGLALLFLPFCVMVGVFIIQFTCLAAAKLDVKGSEFYLSPYIWIILLIVPIIGWVIFIVLLLYLDIDILVQLHKGVGEKYID